MIQRNAVRVLANMRKRGPAVNGVVGGADRRLRRDLCPNGYTPPPPGRVTWRLTPRPAAMASSFQPETPHEPARGSTGRSSYVWLIVLIVLVLAMLAFVLPAYLR